MQRQARKADRFEFNPRSANGSSDSLRNRNTRSGRNGHSVCKPDLSARNTRTRCRRIHETLPKVKVDFPATELTRAFSVTFDLPEGWTVRSDEGVYDDSSSSFDPGYDEYGCALPGRKLLFDENGNLAGAVGFHSYGAEGYAEYGYREPFAHFAMGHVTYFDWDNYHFVDGDSSNCESVYSVSYHGISSAAWIDGWGFHPFYCPTAVSCCATGNPVSVAVELSNTYEDSASLSKRVAESIRFE